MEVIHVCRAGLCGPRHRSGIATASMPAGRSIRIRLKASTSRSSDGRRRLPPYQSPTRGPLLQRNRVSLVSARCRGRGHPANSAWPGEGSNPVVTGAAGTPVAAGLPRRGRPRDAANPHQRDQHQVRYRCLWMIKANNAKAERSRNASSGDSRLAQIEQSAVAAARSQRKSPDRLMCSQLRGEVWASQASGGGLSVVRRCAMASAM